MLRERYNDTIHFNKFGRLTRSMLSWCSDTGRGAGLEFGAEEQWSSEQEVEIESESSKLLLGTPGGQRVAELVGAWDGLAGRLPPDFATKSGSKLLLAALKLTVGTLQHASPIEDGRKPLSRALSVAFILADLRVRLLKFSSLDVSLALCRCFVIFVGVYRKVFPLHFERKSVL